MKSFNLLMFLIASYVCFADDISDSKAVFTISRSALENTNLTAGSILIALQMKLPFPSKGMSYSDVILQIKRSNSNNKIIEQNEDLILVNCYVDDDSNKLILFLSVQYKFQNGKYTQGPVFDNIVDIDIKGKRIH